MAGSVEAQIASLIADCRHALTQWSPLATVREIVERTVADPDKLSAALGKPERGGVSVLHRSDELTILNVVWAPRMVLKPHNHRMWAAIGVYTGREDNTFWRRRDGAPNGEIEASAAKSIGPGEVVPLGPEVIHSVVNPCRGCTGALHVYGGDFFAQERSEWDPESLIEKPYDIDANMELFEQANAVLDLPSKQ